MEKWCPDATIRNSGIPPIPDQVIESMAGRSCYTMLDLFSGYDHHTLDPASCDLTTVQSPIGVQRLTTVPQGWTRAVPIFHANITFILEPEIPDPAQPFIDDSTIKGPQTRYETEDSGYKTIPANPQICRFIWEHINDIYRILHHFLCASATILAKKIFITVPEVVVLGHKCNYEGRVPDDSKIAKIHNWPNCKNLSDVCTFLGIAGYMRIWIKNFSTIAWPLVNLTCKGAPFVWQEEHEQAMQSLKSAIVYSSALISIDYSTDHAVYLSVDSSVHGVGWILMQDCSNGCHCPLHFGSIVWNECKSCYSQAKLKLYGLFCALCATHLYLIRACNLIVEVDASYIRGMLSNPDIQLNTAVNRWIAAILLFNFKLVHVPVSKHKGPDGLSQREPAPGKEEHNDPEDWVDSTLSLGIWVVSWFDMFPTDVHRTDTLVLLLETSNDNDDFVQRAHPHRDHRLPTRFHTGEFISTDTSQAHSRPHLADTPRSTPPFDTEEPDHNINIPDNNNNNNIIDNDFDINNTNNIDNNNSTNLNNNNDSTHILPTSDYFDNNHIEDSTPIKFLANDNASKANAEIDRIRQYLLLRHTPSDLPANALTCFISRAQRFLITGGQLWRRQHSGQHQLYMQPSVRHTLVCDAHDKLGHKGFYSTCCALLNRFWWPALESDVKWYVQMCHQCQIWQTTKI